MNAASFASRSPVGDMIRNAVAPTAGTAASRPRTTSHP